MFLIFLISTCLLVAVTTNDLKNNVSEAVTVENVNGTNQNDTSARRSMYSSGQVFKVEGAVHLKNKPALKLGLPSQILNQHIGALPPSYNYKIPNWGCQQSNQLSTAQVSLLNTFLDFVDHSSDFSRSQAVLASIRNYLDSVFSTAIKTKLLQKIAVIQKHLLAEFYHSQNSPHVPDKNKIIISIDNSLPGLDRPACRAQLANVIRTALNIYQSVVKQPQCQADSLVNLFKSFIIVKPTFEISFDILYGDDTFSVPTSPNGHPIYPGDQISGPFPLPPLVPVPTSAPAPNTPSYPTDSIADLLRPSPGEFPYSPFEPKTNNPFYPPSLPLVVPENPKISLETLIKLFETLQSINVSQGPIKILVFPLLKELFPDGAPQPSPGYQNWIEILGRNPNSEAIVTYLLNLVAGHDWKVQTPDHPSVVGNGEFIEFTYILKQPKPLIYHPYFYVKYRLPYQVFVQNYYLLVQQRPELVSQPSKLYQELLALSNGTQVSSDLGGLNKDESLKLVFHNGALVDTKIIKGQSRLYSTAGLKPPSANFAPNFDHLLARNLETVPNVPNDLYNNNRYIVVSQPLVYTASKKIPLYNEAINEPDVFNINTAYKNTNNAEGLFVDRAKFLQTSHQLGSDAKEGSVHQWIQGLSAPLIPKLSNQPKWNSGTAKLIQTSSQLGSNDKGNELQWIQTSDSNPDEEISLRDISELLNHQSLNSLSGEKGPIVNDFELVTDKSSKRSAGKLASEILKDHHHHGQPPHHQLN